MKRDDFRSKIDSKPPLNDKTERENLERKKLGRTYFKEKMRSN